MTTAENDSGDRAQTKEAIVYARRLQDRLEFLFTAPKTVHIGEALEVGICVSINMAVNLKVLNFELDNIRIQVHRGPSDTQPAAEHSTHDDSWKCIYDYNEDLVKAQALAWHEPKGDGSANKEFVCRGPLVEDSSSTATSSNNESVRYRLTIRLKLKLKGGIREVRSERDVFIT